MNPTSTIALVVLGTILTVEAATAATSPTHADGSEDREILWIDKARGAPSFATYAALMATPGAESIPGLSPSATTSVRSAFRVARGSIEHFANAFPDCVPPPDADPPPAPEWTGRALAVTRSIQEVVSAADTAVLGTVTDVRPGWDFQEGRVLALVHLTISHVLSPRAAGALAPGVAVTYMQNSGEVFFNGKRSCSKDYPGFDAMRPGDGVLLIGTPDERANHVHRHYVFPVRDGSVIPQPYGRSVFEPCRVADLLAGAC